MTIVVVGAGFLGRRLARDLPGATLAPVDITDRDAVAVVLARVRPDVVVNAAGKTGRPNVDWCEANQEATWRSNVLGPLVLAEACAAAGVHLLHLSSGCIFDGRSPSPPSRVSPRTHRARGSAHLRSTLCVGIYAAFRSGGTLAAPSRIGYR